MREPDKSGDHPEVSTLYEKRDYDNRVDVSVRGTKINS